MFLDSGETPVKEYLADNCELLDAYRLPDSVFERTGVKSDIIVLKKS
jgi:type I restriction-modification system DNA methylase subunit